MMLIVIVCFWFWFLCLHRAYAAVLLPHVEIKFASLIRLSVYMCAAICSAACCLMLIVLVIIVVINLLMKVQLY